MRTLFLLLLFANLAFYAYAFVARERSLTPSTTELQLNAQRMRIVRQDEGKSPPGMSACLEWGAVSGADVARADAALAGLEISAGSLRRVAADVTGYWVHIPPAKGKAELDRKLAELKSLGVTDYSAVQDPALGRNAISLGVFSTEDAAQNRLAALQDKGVRSAVVEARPGLIRQVRFYVREPGSGVVAKLAEIQQSFPGSQIKAGRCPADDATKG